MSNKHTPWKAGHFGDSHFREESSLNTGGKMKTYKIIHKKEKWLAASGFYGLDRALKWLENFNPHIWTNKNMKSTDFEIVEEK